MKGKSIIAKSIVLGNRTPERIFIMEQLHRKAALYCRVSTVYQVDRDSLPTQRESLIAYAQHVLGITDYEIFTDAGYSGKNTDRPAYQDMMQRCRRHEFTHILVFKIDRISRNLLDFSQMYVELRKLDITFISRTEQFDTSSAMGEAMLKIILVFAELERRMTSERVMGIMIARAKKGLWNGARMSFGYDWDEKTRFPVVNTEEAQIRYRMYEYINNGGTCGALSRELNERGVRTKRGGKWTATTVRNLLMNPDAKGTLRYNYRESGRGRKKPESEWVIVDDVLPAIVSKEMWEKTQRQLESAKALPKEHRQIYDHPFSKLVYCECGSLCYARKDKPRKNGLHPSVYYCIARTNHWGCMSTSQPGDVMLIPFVFRYLQNMIFVQDHADRFRSAETMQGRLLAGFSDIAGIAHVDEIFDAFQHSRRVDYRPVSAPPISAASGDRKKLKRALERLKELYLYNDMSRDEYVAEKRKIDEKLQALPAEPAAEEAQPAFLESARQFALSSLLRSREPLTYEQLLTYTDDKTLHEFLQRVLRRIDMRGDRIASITFANGVTHEFIYEPK